MDQARQPNAHPIYFYWQPVLEEWGITMSETEFLGYWFKEDKVSTTMVDFATQLRWQGIKVFILSNNFKERADFYGHYPWLSQSIDKTYFSFQTGHIKPDTQAWLQVLTENNLQPGNCLYFDDQQKNITAAQSLGIPAHLFESEAALKSIVSQSLSR